MGAYERKIRSTPKNGKKISYLIINVGKMQKT